MSLYSRPFSSVLFILLFLSTLLLRVYPHTAPAQPIAAVSNKTNSTISCSTSISVADAFLLFVPALLLGSNYVLLKRYNEGDGVFFQWIVCAGVWICGLAVNFIQSSPTFYILAIAGGAIWAAGNLLLIPMIRLVGFNTGVLMWSLVFMSSGWATGFLELMQVPHSRLCVPFFNYGGLFMCVSGVVLLAFLKDKQHYGDVTLSTSNKREGTSFYNRLYNIMRLHSPVRSRHHRFGFEGCGVVNRLLSRLSPLKKKVIGYVLSILMGIAWGTHFLPMQVLQALATRNSYYSVSSLDYMFPYATGVFVTSSLFTAVYSLCMRNSPVILPQSVLPALAVGVTTGVAISLWADLNQRMTPALTFPVIASGTPTIGLLFSIIAYRGWKHLMIFLVSVLVLLSGVLLVLLSKVYPMFKYPTIYDENMIYND